MESNADKLMREKLTTTEFSFDPQAWEQMEMMLDQKKKRRSIFWWWFGGAGMAAALIGGLLWISYFKTSSKEITTPASTVITLSTTSGSISTKEISPTSARISEAEKFVNTALTTHMPNTSAYKVGSNNLSPIVTISEYEANASTSNESTLAENSPFTSSAISINSSELKVNEVLIAEAEQMVSAVLDSTLNELPVATDEPAVDLPVKRRSKFNYSLGLLANVSGTSVGKQVASTKESGTHFFYQCPSFAIGLANDFLFVDRLAISTGLLYAQTSFRVEKPKYSITDSVGTIRNVRSDIRELQIPLMIKGYLYRSKAVSLFASVGVINHIKLREKFTIDYEVPVALNVAPPITTATDIQTIEQLNSFTPTTENVIADFTAAKSSSSGESFGMGRTKRYYASIYTSLGVEISLAKHFLLNAEPMYFFSAQKIGKQPQRKHNLGLNVGLRYTFGAH